LCGRAGMGALGHVAIDGTKMAADAAPSQSRDIEGLRRTARRLIDDAARIDAEEDAAADGDRAGELPAELHDPLRRRQLIDTLIADAAADTDPRRAQARAADAGKAGRVLDLIDDLETAAAVAASPRREALATRADRSEANLTRIRDAATRRYQDRQDREAAAAAAGRTLPGTRPVPPERDAHVRDAADRAARARQRLTDHDTTHRTVTGKRNITDPDARFMPVTGGGYLLGYNSQIAVAADHLILAVDVVTTPGDVTQLTSMLTRLEHAVAILRHATGNPDLTVGTALFDAGYNSDANLTAPGPDRLIAQGTRRNPTGGTPPPDPPDTTATPRQHMARRLSTDAGRTLYRKRAATVEPVNGHLKDRRGLRRFARRGLTAALAELNLAALTTNLLRLHTHTT
jgi:Transposase DDE domain